MDEKYTAELKLLKKVTRFPAKSNFTTDINDLKNIMNKYLPEIYKKEPELYLKILNEYERIKTYAAYKPLANKNIISFCGKYGMGKSSLLNSLYGGNIIPADVDPRTNITAYIACGKSETVYAVNRFDFLAELTHNEIHSVLKGLDTENPDTSSALGHLLKSFLTFTNTPKLKHVAFAVHAGYIPENDKNYDPKYNKYELLKKINHSNAVLWFADIDPKTSAITSDDIEILKKIDSNIPKLVIITKADLYRESDFPEIVEKTQKILNASRIKYIDVLSYSDKTAEKYDKYKILAYFDRWDKSPEVINFSQEFEKTFEQIQNKNNVHLQDFQFENFKSVLLPEIQKVSCDIYDVEKAFQTEKKNGFVPVETIMNERTSKSKNPLKNLDLSQVKVSELPIPNPEKLFRSYNDRTQKDLSKYERYINSVSLSISETMKNIKPLFSFSQKNDEYKKNVSSIIATSFNVDMTEPKTDENEETETTKKPDKRSSRSERRAKAAQEKEKEREVAKEKETERPSSRISNSERSSTRHSSRIADNLQSTSTGRTSTVFKRDNIPGRNNTDGNIPRRKLR